MSLISVNTYFSYNYPGVTGNGNSTGGYFDAGGTKASMAITENTDGTLTFWMYGIEGESGFQTNLLQWNLAWSGPISNTVGNTSQMIITEGTQAGQAGGPPYGQWGTGTDNGINNGGFGYQSISAGGWDVVTINGNPAFRWRLHPPAGSAGQQIHCFNIQHFISYTYGSQNNGWYADGAPSGASPITLRGATPLPPFISNVSPATACIGTTVTLTGTNFSNQYSVYINDQGHPAQNVAFPNSSTCTFVVPNNVPAGVATIIMSNGTTQSTGQLIIAANANITSITDTDSNQANQGAQGEHISVAGTGFGSSQGTSVLQIQTGPSTFVSIVPTSWTDTNIAFVVPTITPGIYQLQVQTHCNTAQLQFTVVNRAPVGPPPQLQLFPQTVTLHENQVTQFLAFVLTAGLQPVDDTTISTWYVNGIAGGNSAIGTIVNGYYTAPSTLSGSSTVTISAHFTYEGPEGSYIGEVLTATGTVSLVPLANSTATFSTITVLTQLNIFLGDGTFGYVPIGTSIQLYPAQYLYVKFNRTLDPNTHIPIATNVAAQRLQLYAKNALDPDIANEIYNLNAPSLDANGNILTQLTVILGIIDPSDGLWHSMWDIGLPAPSGPDTDMLAMAKSLPKDSQLYADSLPAFKDGSFDGSIIDYIDDLSGAHQSQITAFNKRVNTLVTGTCFYDAQASTLEIIDPLTVFGLNKENNYIQLNIINKDTISVKPGEIVYFENERLNIAKIGSKINASSALIIGVCLENKFYSKWPILPQYTINIKD